MIILADTYIGSRTTATERVVGELLNFIYAIRIIDLEYMGAIMVNSFISLSTQHM